VEHGVDVVPLEAVQYFRGIRDVALVEGKVAPVVEDACVVERRTVVELVERDDVVRVRVCEDEVPDQPAGSANCQNLLPYGSLEDIHEAGPSCYHDVLDIGERLESGGAGEQRRLSPDAIVLKDIVCLADAFYINGKSALFKLAAISDPFRVRLAEMAHSPLAAPFRDVAPPETVMFRE
jgi:hypothetical protein